MAVSCGHLVSFNAWVTPDTNVNLGIFGDNYEVSLYIDYVRVELGRLETEAKEAAALDDL